MTIRLVRTTNTSAYFSSSPDPAGIVYLSNINQLLISDSEVNETPLFQGDNLFTINLNGIATDFGDVLDFSTEPTGLSYKPATNTLFISDDAARRISEISSGNDGVFGSDDDTLVNRFPTRPFGSDDPEDLAYHPDTDTLFITDGLDSIVYEVDLDGNAVSNFSTADFGLSDPEGVGINDRSGNLFMVGEPTDFVFETTTDGDLVQKIYIGNANPVQPAGIEIAPRSNGNPNQTSLYVVDRGIDESEDINENDGKLYEFALSTTIFATTRNTVTIDGNSFDDEDVIAYDARRGRWFKFLDLSDLGLGNRDVDAVHRNDDGSFLLSFNQDFNLDGLGPLDDADIVRFIPTSVGFNTAGTFERYFDGSDVSLTRNAEDIDAVSIAPNGDILLSTNGHYNVGGGLSGNDEDILAFSPTSLGENTAGTFSLYFDGSDVDLNDVNSEDVKGVSVLDNGDIILSTSGAYSVNGLSGSGGDLISFESTSLGDNTAGTYSIFSDNLGNGFDSQTFSDFSLA